MYYLILAGRVGFVEQLLVGIQRYLHKPTPTDPQIEHDPIQPIEPHWQN